MISRRMVAWVCVSILLLICWATLTIDIEWYRISFQPATATNSDLCSQLPDTSPEVIHQAPSDPGPKAIAPITRKHVAIASFFSYHFDVYMALAWTLERVLAAVPGSNLHVFAQPFFYGFQSVVEDLGLYHGARGGIEDFMPYVRSNPTLDTIILGTCEVECARYQYMNARPTLLTKYC